MAKLHDEFMDAIRIGVIRAIADCTVPAAYDDIYEALADPEAPAVIADYLWNGGSIRVMVHVALTQLVAQGRVIVVERRGIGRFYDLSPLDRLAAQG